MRCEEIKAERVGTKRRENEDVHTEEEAEEEWSEARIRIYELRSTGEKQKVATEIEGLDSSRPGTRKTRKGTYVRRCIYSSRSSSRKTRIYRRRRNNNDNNSISITENRLSC